MISRIFALCACSILVAALIILPGCSSAPGKTVPKTYTVEIVSMKFQPAELTVHKGDTVIFLNKDMVVHNVTEDRDKGWSSSSLPIDQSYQLAVTGTVHYYCSIHPMMKGVIMVE